MALNMLLAAGFCMAGAPLSKGVSPAVREVVWATPMDWDRYVDQNGKGLYVDIVQKVFGSEGIQIKRVASPWKRALRDVKGGRADFTGGVDPSPDYVQSRFPIDQSGEYVFFAKKIMGANTDVHELVKKHSGVWTLGYIDEFPAAIKSLLKGEDIADREQALRMVLAGRADYYLDNAFQMATSLSHQSYAKDQFQCRELFNAKVYMSFTPSPRGRAIRAIWDKRIELLFRSGELQKIYESWRFRFPEFPITLPNQQLDATADYLSCLDVSRIANDKR